MIKLKSLPSVYFAAHLINQLSTVSVYRLFIQHSESGNEAIRYKLEETAFSRQYKLAPIKLI